VNPVTPQPVRAKAVRAHAGAGGGGRASDKVLRDLRRMIVTLELPPGAVVTETSLVQSLSCSRTPLREALQRLSHEHLVVAVPRRGVTIAELGIVDFTSVVEALLAVDKSVARLAAMHITDEELALMDELLAQSGEAVIAGDMGEFVDLDFTIHAAIGSACGNRFLCEFQEMLLRLLSRYIYLAVRDEANAEGAIADHRRIVEALRARDPDACEESLRTHIENARERMRSAL
jgi:DNA-binding GntR family transcriptional regulator